MEGPREVMKMPLFLFPLLLFFSHKAMLSIMLVVAWLVGIHLSGESGNHELQSLMFGMVNFVFVH